MTRLLLEEIEACPGTNDVKLNPSDSSPADNPPARAKSPIGEAVTVGALVLAVLPAAVPAVIDYVKEWTLRPGNTPIRVKIQVGEKIAEAEFDPRVIAKDDVVKLLSGVHALVEPKDKD